jgi:hypothetical protein
MTRRREPVTAREKIADVLGWANRQGLRNIAAQLQSALDLMPADETHAQRQRKRALMNEITPPKGHA